MSISSFLLDHIPSVAKMEELENDEEVSRFCSDDEGQVL
jgi:hypothetical protein